VLQTALLFLLVWAPPVVGNSSTWDTQRPLDRMHCNVMRPGAGVRDGLCFHRRSSETVRKKIRRPFKKKYFGEHVYQTCDWLLCRCVNQLLPIRDLNVVCVCLLHCTCICVSNVTFAVKASHGFVFQPIVTAKITT
jgi:hypothetical protein